MTLLTLASRQVWPQILAVLHYRPTRLVLLHSREENESAGPACRLRTLLTRQRLLPEGAVELVPAPHDDYGRAIDALADTAERRLLDDSNCRVNLTGGNKLMALAAFEWCRLAGVPCFYLERDLRVFTFQPGNTDLLPLPDFKLDPHLAGGLEPLALLECQLGGAEVVGAGQRLTLNQQGRSLSEEEWKQSLAAGEDARRFLTWDVPELKQNPGFALEYATAAALLRLGVPVVQRSVRLAPKVLRGSGRTEGEIDLVFNWSGKLWVVDCKDRLPAESRVGRLRAEIGRHTASGQHLEELLIRIEDELRERELHPLKEDLLAVAETAGLLGQAICVRRTPLPPEAADFARSRNLHVVLKDRLTAGLRLCLFPDEPASLDQLRSLARARTRAVA